ncbi:hypothetical protein AB0C10_36995 [Microbispora amethystogenes]|uniref:hypothetical protein n=1 Tax=Microbispora amethystogenes TaxID=1427754 RepID=UPI0033E8E0EC
MSATFPAGLIRPWYPAGQIGHVLPDCEDLTRWVPEPTEGAGWLDPNDAKTCRKCLKRAYPDLYRDVPSWDAECRTCDAQMSDEWEGDEPFSEKDAKDWKRDHECEPDVKIIPPKPKAEKAA